jgi:hypothetical protein
VNADQVTEMELGEEEDIIETLGLALSHRERLLEAELEGAIETFSKDLK